MTIVVWIILGLVIGALAKVMMPGQDGGGFIMTALLGIAGAVVGGSIASAVGLASFTGLNAPGIVIAVLGAMLLLGIHRMIRSRAS